MHGGIPRFESDDVRPAEAAGERLPIRASGIGSRDRGVVRAQHATLGFRFGAACRWVEVDLAARSLNLVVEVDGYHHFQDPEAFRRDRRKDLELQKHGYLVAMGDQAGSDVVERLEDVMDTILESGCSAAANRRAAFEAKSCPSNHKSDEDLVRSGLRSLGRDYYSWSQGAHRQRSRKTLRPLPSASMGGGAARTERIDRSSCGAGVERPGHQLQLAGQDQEGRTQGGWLLMAMQARTSTSWGRGAQAGGYVEPVAEEGLSPCPCPGDACV